jgi:hypothetical protein
MRVLLLAVEVVVRSQITTCISLIRIYYVTERQAALLHGNWLLARPSGANPHAAVCMIYLWF